MRSLSSLLGHFNPVRILVIGDFMLDTYTIGKVRRISPEAPVSVLHVEKEENRPGGAGNVVVNLLALGAQVVAVGRVGEDAAGREILSILEKEGVDVSNFIHEPHYPTPVKNRLIASAQQMLRVDHEKISALPEVLEQKIVKRLPTLLEGVDVVAISDYGKGFLTPSLLMAFIEIAREKKIPVIVDPKGQDFSRYEGATIIKPNLSEAYAAARLPAEAPLERVAATIFHDCAIDELLITRSEAGMTLYTKGGKSFDFPVRSREVKDVTGAGDTVLATISMALANGIDTQSGAQLANIAAGIAIERIGCARVTLSELAERLLELDIENKIFDGEHLFVLKQALLDKRYTILAIDGSQGMTTPLFRAIRKLATKNRADKLIIYVKEESPDEEFLSLLSSLSEVDFIVLKCDKLKSLCEAIHPHQIYQLEAGNLISIDTLSPLLR